jgi:Siphovirus Gp157
MPTIFQIADEIAALHDLLTECAGEITEAETETAIDQWLADNEQALEKKVDGYCGLIREFEARSEAREIEAKRLMALAGSDANQAKRLKDRLKYFFEICAIKKLDTPRFRLSIQANGGQAPLVFPPEWETFPENAPEVFHKREIKLDRAAIREAIRNDEETHGAFLGERGTRLSIR